MKEGADLGQAQVKLDDLVEVVVDVAVIAVVHVDVIMGRIPLLRCWPRSLAGYQQDRPEAAYQGDILISFL